MPVIEIKALEQQPGVDVGAALDAVCAEVASLLEEEPAGTWATWTTLERYHEGGRAAGRQPASTHPPLVVVRGFEGKPELIVRALLDTVAAALTRELGLAPGNVFVTYEEARRGRLHSGGAVAG